MAEHDSLRACALHRVGHVGRLSRAGAGAGGERGSEEGEGGGGGFGGGEGEAGANPALVKIVCL